MNAGEWLIKAAQTLGSRLEAEVLLAHLFQVDRSRLLAHPEWQVPELPAAQLLERRLSREPVAYIVGRKEFYGREFLVDRRVLIPRPETEVLVEAMISRLPDGAVCADVGTGSGCIAVSLAIERPDTRWIATDISGGALEVAAENVRRQIGFGEPRPQVSFVGACLLDAFHAASFDAVVSNPPYIAPGDPRLEPEVAEWEPQEALLSPSGMAAIKALVSGAVEVLKPGGILAFEFGEGQEETVADLLASSWQFKLLNDLAGKPRVAIATNAKSKPENA